MFLSRKLGVQLVDGNPATLAQAKTPYTAHIRDQLDKYKLRIESDQCVSGTLQIDGDGSESLYLPDGYLAPNNLSVSVSTDALIKIELTHGVLSDEFLVRGEPGNEGLFSCCQPVDSIVVHNGTSEPISIKYALFQLPNLRDPESWALGYLATGVGPS